MILYNLPAHHQLYMYKLKDQDLQVDLCSVDDTLNRNNDI